MDKPEQNKLNELEQKIEQAQQTRDIKEGKIPNSNKAVYSSAHAGIEFALSILVGGYLGYLLDQYLGTHPLFLIILFFFGVGSGFMTLYRTSKKMGGSIGFSELHQREKKDKNDTKKNNIS